ncbi:MAG: hypothetical protein DBP02_07770 [gamma proteobacterium symbiont of Ctena orbiculata]|nr:MAG: hypothetical protein DBP02_07770 [gamma proteobacterium symbiont of Ctena orbiculata]
MDGQTVGFIGGAFGAVIGIIGGIVGTYFSIKNTNSQAEKNFMIRVSIFVWIAIIIFLALLLLLPKPYLITHEAQLLSLWCKHNGTY